MHKHKDNNFSFSLRSLASCENETQHKHKEICCVWPIKALVRDSPASEHLNKMAVAVVDFDGYCRRSFSLA